ncbi:MAG: hypothetical protein ABSF82_10105 [Candidatus Bathyarchaeia archaeon]
MDEITKRTQPIESLSELVKIIFGLALSIGAISLISRLPTKPLGILVDVAEFGFSFLILISVWMGYTNIMSVLPMEDSVTVILNLVLLFLVSIEPYLFYLNITFDLLSHELLLNSASMLYALDMTGLMLILALFTHQLAREERGLVSKESMARFKRVRNTLFISAGLFAITILPLFWTLKLWDLPIRFYFWFIPLVLSSVRHISDRGFQE